MHYSNGRVAKVGDVVRGKGYNIKHEIIGLMLKIKVGDASCNCEVACVSSGSQVFLASMPNNAVVPGADHPVLCYRGVDPAYGKVEATIEYGQCDAFVALDPKTGEVLSAE